MDNLALLHNGSESAIGKLFAHAEAAKSAAREVEQQIHLAYTGLQAVVDFLNVDINVMSILSCEDPAGAMEVTVHSIMHAIQSLMPQHVQPDLGPPAVGHSLPQDNNALEGRHIDSDAAPVTNGFKGDGFESHATCVSGPGPSAALRPPDGCHAPREAEQAVVPAALLTSSSVPQQLSACPARSPEQLQTQSTTTRQHHPNSCALPDPSPVNEDQAAAIVQSPAAPEQPSQLPNDHASPPTLTCNFTDLLATPPSQRQQRQTFPETEVFMPFFTSQMPAVPKPKAQGCPGETAVASAADKACASKQMPQHQHATAEPESSAIRPVEGHAEQMCVEVIHAADGLQEVKQELSSPPVTAAGLSAAKQCEDASSHAQSASDQRPSKMLPATLGECINGTSAVAQAMPSLPVQAPPTASPTVVPSHPTSTGLTASKLVAATPEAAPIPEPPRFDQAGQSAHAPALPRAVGASFGWRPLGAAQPALKRLARSIRPAPHVPAAAGIAQHEPEPTVQDHKGVPSKDHTMGATANPVEDICAPTLCGAANARDTCSPHPDIVIATTTIPDTAVAAVADPMQCPTAVPTSAAGPPTFHEEQRKDCATGAAPEAHDDGPVLRGEDGDVSCELLEGVSPRSKHQEQRQGIAREKVAECEVKLGSETSAEQCGAPSPPDEEHARTAAPPDGVPATRVRKGAWRKRGGRAKVGAAAETQAGVAKADAAHPEAQVVEDLEKAAAGAASRKGATVSTAAATATFRASTAVSPMAAAAASRPSACKPPRPSPPVVVAEILSRSPARSAAAAREGPASRSQLTNSTVAAAPAALGDAKPLQLSTATAGRRRVGRSGGAPSDSSLGGENTAPGGAGASGVGGTGRKRMAATPAQPTSAAAGDGKAGDGKAVRKGKWQSRKNTNAIFESKDRKRTGRIDAMLRSAAASGGRHASAATGTATPALVLEKADVAAGFDGTLQQRRVAAVAAAAAGSGTVRVGGPKVYDQRVRKRSDREALQAWECGECMEFYELLARKGYEYNAEVFGSCAECGTARKKTRVYGSGGARGGDGDGCESEPSTPDGKGDGAGNLLQAVGRHRHQFVAPPTQENFWAIGFEDDWDAPKRPWRKNGVNKNRMVS